MYRLQAHQETLFCKNKKKLKKEVVRGFPGCEKPISLDLKALVFVLCWHRHSLLILMLKISAPESPSSEMSSKRGRQFIVKPVERRLLW